jgi:hydrogenase maturation factor
VYKPNEGHLAEGKLPAEILGPMLDSMPTNGLPVSNRIGMDAGIIKIYGKEIFSCSQSAFGSDPGIGKKLVSDLFRVTKNVGKAVVVNPVVLVPIDTDVETIRRILTEISETAESLAIIVGKGHTEVTSVVNGVTLMATLLGSV